MKAPPPLKDFWASTHVNAPKAEGRHGRSLAVSTETEHMGGGQGLGVGSEGNGEWQLTGMGFACGVIKIF